MGAKSSIEWTESTWNPVTGCSQVSPGCANCYARRMAARLQAAGNPRYSRGFTVTLQEDLVDLPSRWRTPRMVFVNSMSDLFHEDVPARFIRSVFATMVSAGHHTYQLLTKRADRLADMAPELPWPPNVWAGVSVETQEYAGRIDALRQVPSAVRFVSFEPLLGPVENVDLSCIDWAIVGGESGTRARPMREAWAVSLRDQCVEAGVAFFFKQWGGVRRKEAGRELGGRTWSQMPPGGQHRLVVAG